jgi:hypothetical protein
MLLWAVVVERQRRARVDRIIFLAAERPEDAEGMARALYRSEGKIPERFRFLAQPVVEVPGPGGTVYQVRLHPLPPRNG